MKMFKKLMAVALAGVMALTLLAGCANKIVPVSEKEILACITDSNPVSYPGKDGVVKITLKGAEEADAVKALKVLQDYKEANKDTEILDQNGYIDVNVFMANNSAFAEALRRKKRSGSAVSRSRITRASTCRKRITASWQTVCCHVPAL